MRVCHGMWRSRMGHPAADLPTESALPTAIFLPPQAGVLAPSPVELAAQNHCVPACRLRETSSMCGQWTVVRAAHGASAQQVAVCGRHHTHQTYRRVSVWVVLHLTPGLDDPGRNEPIDLARTTNNHLYPCHFLDSTDLIAQSGAGADQMCKITNDRDSQPRINDPATTHAVETAWTSRFSASMTCLNSKGTCTFRSCGPVLSQITALAREAAPTHLARDEQPEPEHDASTRLPVILGPKILCQLLDDIPVPPPLLLQRNMDRVSAEVLLRLRLRNCGRLCRLWRLRDGSLSLLWLLS